MPKIFVSHAWEDNETSRKLARQLKIDGAEVFIYYSQIEYGDVLPEAFRDAIGWCDIFIQIWSRAASTSPGIRLEWQQALDLKKIMITCLLDDTKQSSAFQGFLFINFIDFNQGHHDLAHLLNLNLPEEKQPEEGAAENADLPETDIKVIQLRANPEKLDDAQVETMIKKYDFFDLKRNAEAHGLKRQFEMLEVNGDKVVFDPMTQLIWQNSGSLNSMWYEEVKECISELNRTGYAGFNDWRLPTLEEAMSLMNNEKKSDGLYIDPSFDGKQMNIWTSDLSHNATRAWVVFFNFGNCHVNCFDFKNFVRAVRTMSID